MDTLASRMTTSLKWHSNAVFINRTAGKGTHPGKSLSNKRTRSRTVGAHLRNGTKQTQEVRRQVKR